MVARRCARCGNQAPKGRTFCRSCALEEARRQTARLRRAKRLGLKCLVCQKPSTYPICDSCDRNLRHEPKRKPDYRDRLYSVRSVVSGALPSLGKGSR